jgi:hypothetical protein
MIIDCGQCAVRGAACARCTVTFVTEDPPPGVRIRAAVSGDAPAGRDGESPVIELDDADLRALAALANAGLVPPLRYAPPPRQARPAKPTKPITPAEPMAKAS